MKKDYALEGLRGVAAFGVVLSHLLFSLFPYLAHNFAPQQNIPRAYWWEEFASWPIFTVFYNGGFAVSIFFVLSGYVLTKKAFATGDAHEFQLSAIKRFPRLVIPAFASIMFAWALLAAGAMHTFLIPQLGSAGWPFAQYNAPVSFFAALWSGAIGAAIFGDVGLNTPLWTIRIELFGSLWLFAAYTLIGNRRPFYTFLLYLAFAMFLAPGSDMIMHFVAIFSGSVIHYVQRQLKQNRILPTALIIAGLIGGGFDLSGFYGWLHEITLPALIPPFPNLEAFEKTFYNSIGAFLIVCGVVGHAGASRALAGRIPAYLGRISFSMYLLHWPIICSLAFGLMGLFKLQMGLGHLLSSAITVPVTIAVVIIASDIFERWVDRPAIRLAGVLAKRYWAPLPTAPIAPVPAGAASAAPA